MEIKAGDLNENVIYKKKKNNKKKKEKKRFLISYLLFTSGLTYRNTINLFYYLKGGTKAKRNSGNHNIKNDAVFIYRISIRIQEKIFINVNYNAKIITNLFKKRLKIQKIFLNTGSRL